MIYDYEKFVFIVAEGHTYESIYHGVPVELCTYCDAEKNVDEHKDDCDMIQAREVLGDKWLAYEKQRGITIESYHGKDNRYVNCDICGKLVKDVGINSHQRQNPRCLEKQRGLGYKECS